MKIFMLVTVQSALTPGIKKHTITKITKVVSGSTPETLDALMNLYGSIIEAGIYKAPTIKTAEAAKVIEIPKETSTSPLSMNWRLSLVKWESTPMKY